MRCEMEAERKNITAGYARVSTADQNLDRQKDMLMSLTQVFDKV